jgi:hypothetical protein
MQSDEKIQAHLVSVWRESKRFLSIGGKEGMLVLTNKHLIFIHKTEAKMKWWQAIRQRQVLNFLKSKNTLIRHDGYEESNLIKDLENKKNIQLSFDEIINITFEEKEWGSILLLEYEKENKRQKYQYSIAQDWVKYPIKEPTKYMKVDWEPFVQYIKDRQNFIN